MKYEHCVTSRIGEFAGEWTKMCAEFKKSDKDFWVIA
jgi:hypothetical protein